MSGFILPDQPLIARVIGIDPGSSKLGYGVIEYNTITSEIIRSYCGTIVAERFIVEEDLQATIRGAANQRIRVLAERIKNLVEHVQPVMMGMETPFFNPTKPSAFAVLCLVMNMVEDAWGSFNPYVPIAKATPSVVKNGVGVKGGQGKDPVREAVLKLDLRYCDDMPLDKHGPDAIDGLAVAYTVYKGMLKDYHFHLKGTIP